MKDTSFIYILLLISLFLAFKMSQTDLKRRLIPDIYLFPFMLIGFLLTGISGFFPSPTVAAMTAILAYGLTFITSIVFEKIQDRKNKSKDKKERFSHPPIGMGDIKLIAAGGIWVASELWIALIVAFLLGCLWNIQKKQKFIPFAPFFLIGLFIALLYRYFLL